MYSPFIMPFGKYKGMHFDAIPTSYFDWLLNQDWLSDQLRNQIKTWNHSNSSDESGHSNHNYRNHSQTENPVTPKLTAEEMTDLQKIIKLGFKALALKYHPDTGGTNEEMKRLNSLIKKLHIIGL